jgi:hypothetical protein
MNNRPANVPTVAVVGAAVVITGNPVDVLTRIAIECSARPRASNHGDRDARGHRGRLRGGPCRPPHPAAASRDVPGPRAHGVTSAGSSRRGYP